MKVTGPLPFIDWDPTESRGWEEFERAVAAARILMLGEQSHGDGTAFELKSKLVSHLHQEHGFNVLAFESCFYSLTRVWQRLESSRQAREEIPAQVYGHWRSARETEPLWELVARRFESDRPLVVAGFDPRHAGPFARARLRDELREFVSEVSPGLVGSDRWRGFERLLTELLEREYRHRVDSSDRSLFTEVLWEVRDAVAGRDDGLASFWRQELANLECGATLAWSFAGRDRGMAENLLWLANERFPNEKLIVWAHNWHIVKSSGAVAAVDSSYRRQFRKYPDVPMGEVVAQSLPDVYCLALIAGSGETRPLAYSGDYQTSERVPAPPASSLEARLLEEEAEVRFVALPADGESSVMSGLEHGRPLDLAWSKVFDGVLFLPEVKGLTVPPPATGSNSVPAETSERGATSSGDSRSRSNRPDPVSAARAIVSRRFPGADVALLAGSAADGRANESSDLDLVIIDGDLPGPYRETFEEAGWPVEAFVYTPEGYREWFDSDLRRRRPSLVRMCAEGEILLDRDGSAADLQAQARTALERGPTPLSDEECEQLRYRITDLLMDLEGELNDEERLFTVAELTPLLADLACDTAGVWRGAAKWAPRMLERVEPGLAGRLATAARVCARGGGCGQLLSLADELLEPVGGRFFVGYSRGKVRGR